ncbi:PIG-L family deacetylase [Candidatus Woesearchaeota archaeon]|nr:PIG-L family deacetylase [Candidatus Woesearchaeota archaeon]
MKKQETILVCSAHSDDFVLGAGGTIKNYTQDGKKVIAIVFSYGEKSHPWLKEGVIQKMRSKETFEACKILECQTFFYDLKELKFLEEYKEKNVLVQLVDLIEKEKPTKIFTHSPEDPHPDHKAVYAITLELWENLSQKIKPELYIYSIWNPVSLQTRYPSLYVDITKTFKAKLSALKTFRSQKIHVAYPVILLLYRTIKDGFKIRKRFGEHFFRIR